MINQVLYFNRKALAYYPKDFLQVEAFYDLRLGVYCFYLLLILGRGLHIKGRERRFAKISCNVLTM